MGFNDGASAIKTWECPNCHQELYEYQEVCPDCKKKAGVVEKKEPEAKATIQVHTAHGTQERKINKETFKIATGPKSICILCQVNEQEVEGHRCKTCAEMERSCEIAIDFSEYRHIQREVIQSARKEFRSFSQQILWLLSKALKLND